MNVGDIYQHTSGVEFMICKILGDSEETDTYALISLLSGESYGQSQQQLTSALLGGNNRFKLKSKS